jgi:hypothetical protein
MTRLQDAQKALVALHLELEPFSGHGEGSANRVYLEPVLLQALMTVVDFLPTALQTEVRQLIDISRVLRGMWGAYGSYVRLRPEQLEGEQIVSLHENEDDAEQALGRIQALGVQGRIRQVQATISPLPHGHPAASVQDVTQWAVLVSAESDNLALRALLYPQTHAGIGATVAAYRQDRQRNTIMNQNQNKQQDQPQVISQEQLIAAYRSAVHAHKSSRNFTVEEWAGFLFAIRVDQHIDLSDQVREGNPQLYQRNLEAAARILIQQERQQELKQQGWKDFVKLVVNALQFNR